MPESLTKDVNIIERAHSCPLLCWVHCPSIISCYQAHHQGWATQHKRAAALPPSIVVHKETQGHHSGLMTHLESWIAVIAQGIVQIEHGDAMELLQTKHHVNNGCVTLWPCHLH